MLQLISAVQVGGCLSCPPLGKGLMTAKLLYICTVGTFTGAAQIRYCCWETLGSGEQPIWSNSANPVLPQFSCFTESAARNVLAPWEEASTAAAHALMFARTKGERPWFTPCLLAGAQARVQVVIA